MSSVAPRIVLAERAPRSDYAVAFEPDAFVVEGVPWRGSRRVALRDVFGIERSGAWLWIGAGVVPVVLGGEDVPAERLARVEAELRARLAALPGGAARLARLDMRRAAKLHRPWLTLALALALSVAFALAPQDVSALRAATNVLLLVSLGLLAEPWLGAWRVLASGAAAWLAASAASASPWRALAPLAVALGWAGLLAAVRMFHEPELSVRCRSALDGGALLSLAVAAHALGLGAAPLGVAAAALAGALVASRTLRHWPEGTGPRPH